MTVKGHATTAAKTAQTVEKPNIVNVWAIDVFFFFSVMLIMADVSKPDNIWGGL